MAGGDISEFEPVFDDLALQLQQTGAPEDRSGSWFEGLARFSRHSFARLLLEPTDGDLRLYLELALGPTDAPRRLADAVADRLADASETDWTIESDDSPWILEATLADDDGRDRLRSLLGDLVELTEHFDTVDSTDQWLELLTDTETETTEDTEAPDETGTESGDTPFESIGDGSSDEPPSGDDADQQARVETAEAIRDGDRLLVTIGFTQVLATRHLDALSEGLDHHLHTKFEVESRPADADDVDLPSPARSVLSLQIDPDDYIGDLDELQRDVQKFLDRLEKFSSYGVDLFEYLGVGETVFETDEDTDDADESQLDFDRRATPRRTEDRDPEPSASRLEPAPGAATEDDDVVLQLDPDDEPAGETLEAKDYTDPRLRRPDAETALVDVVLRHPGYSDDRIGQVLSILLSIEYHNALDLADDAPCVIAWGVSQSRGRRFKDVIEGAGGKVVLVEPGTFGEG